MSMMNTTNKFTTKKFTRLQCPSCKGECVSTDITFMDSMYGEAMVGPCITCKGEGTVLRLTASIEREAREARERDDRLARQEVGDMPDWMM